MTQDDDLLLRALGRMRMLQPDLRWEERVRQRCHDRILKSSDAQRRRTSSRRRRCGGETIRSPGHDFSQAAARSDLLRAKPF